MSSEETVDTSEGPKKALVYLGPEPPRHLQIARTGGGHMLGASLINDVGVHLVLTENSLKW